MSEIKITWKKIKDVVYILGMVGIGCGWLVDHRVTKFKHEIRDQMQDEKISAQAAEIRELKFNYEKQISYVKENTDNILWIVRILELDGK